MYDSSFLNEKRIDNESLSLLNFNLYTKFDICEIVVISMKRRLS